MGNFLNIPEEIYLLSIDDEGVQGEDFKSENFDLIISAAILMDLALLHRIDSDSENIIPDKLVPVGDILLDGVVEEIKEQGDDKRRIDDWISYLSIHGPYFRDEIVLSLVRKTVLKIQDEKTFWFFSKRKYPMIDGTEQEEVQSRIRHLIFTDNLPDERDIVIVSILKNSNLIGAVFTAEEIAQYGDRIDQIAKMDFIGQAIAKVLKSYDISGFDKLFGVKSSEEMLEAHALNLKTKFRIKSDDKMPSWLRKGTPQYQKSLDFVGKVGHADITFNPRTKEYSELKMSYTSHVFGSGS